MPTRPRGKSANEIADLVQSHDESVGRRRQSWGRRPGSQTNDHVTGDWPNYRGVLVCRSGREMTLLISGRTAAEIW